MDAHYNLKLYKKLKLFHFMFVVFIKQKSYQKLRCTNNKIIKKIQTSTCVTQKIKVIMKYWGKLLCSSRGP